MKTLTIALAVLGLAVMTTMVGYFGLDTVAATVGSVGWGGFGLLVLWQLGLFGVIGAAWTVIVPKRGGVASWVFLWGRMVRDSAGACLPFSTVGGFVLGARAVTLHGVSWPMAAGSTVVDVTAEFVAQIVFAIIGLVILLVRVPHSAFAGPLAITLALAAAAVLGFIRAQQGLTPLFARLGRRIAGRWFGGTGDGIDSLQTELKVLYRRTARLALSSSLHLLGWFTTAMGGWIAYWLLGADLDIGAAVAIEALLNITLAITFVVPAAAGVQEAAYAGFGTLFGLPPELSLGVSLLRRAKDLVLGVPILLMWQFAEVRRLRVAHNS